MNSAICNAIATRFPIKFDYGGGRRVVEPHTHGISSANNEVLRGYQVSGYSSSRQAPFWSLFAVSKMSNLSVTASTFAQNRPQYDPDDDGMVEVHCHV